jgi:hypothetical protein
VVWQDARFNGGTNDQVVISTSSDPLGRTGTWTAPQLVSPTGDAAAFNPSVTVNGSGEVAVVFNDFRNLDSAPNSVLPTDVWVREANGRASTLTFDRETHLAGSFNLEAAPLSQGFFLGDHTGVSSNPSTGSFNPIWVGTNCADASCTAIGNPTGAPTGGRDPTDVVTYIDTDLALVQPANLTLEATGPSGATVRYPLPTVTDEDATLPVPTCAPASGSAFTIGTATVHCSVSDADDTNSPATASFTVTVKGAAQQLTDLHAAVQGVGPGTSLADKVQSAQASLQAGDVVGACGTLDAFVHEVRAQAGKIMPQTDPQELVDAATRIRAVLGCT